MGTPPGPAPTGINNGDTPEDLKDKTQEAKEKEAAEAKKRLSRITTQPGDTSLLDAARRVRQQHPTPGLPSTTIDGHGHTAKSNVAKPGSPNPSAARPDAPKPHPDAPKPHPDAPKPHPDVPKPHAAKPGDPHSGVAHPGTTRTGDSTVNVPVGKFPFRSIIILPGSLDAPPAIDSGKTPIAVDRNKERLTVDAPVAPGSLIEQHRLETATKGLKEAVARKDHEAVVAILRDNVKNKYQAAQLENNFNKTNQPNDNSFNVALREVLPPKEYEAAVNILCGQDDAASRVHKIMTELDQVEQNNQKAREGSISALVTGPGDHERSRSENNLLLTLATLKPDERTRMQADYENRQHHGLQAGLGNPALTEETRAAANIYLTGKRDANGQYSPEDVTKLANLALKQGNLTALRTAYLNTSDKTRQAIGPEVEKALKNSDLDADQREQAQFILKHGEESLVTQIKENTKMIGSKSSEDSIKDACKNLSKKQQELFLKGKTLLEQKKGADDPEAVKYYEDVQKAMSKAGKPGQVALWNDLVEHKDGSIMGKLSGHIGSWMNDPPPEMLKTLRDKLSEQDLQTLRSDPNYAKRVADYLEANGAAAGPVREVLEQIGSEAGKRPKDKPMTAEEARQVANRGVQSHNEADVRVFFGALNATSERVVPRHGGEPDPSLTHYIRHPDRALKVVQEEFAKDPSLAERLRNPKTEEDKKLSEEFKGDLKTVMGDSNPEYEKAAQALLNGGRLTLDQQRLVYGDQFWSDKSTRLREVLNAPKEELQGLLDPSHPERKAKLFEGLDENQKATLENILKSPGGKPTDVDLLRSAAVGLGTTKEELSERWSKMSEQEREKAKKDYRDKYKSEPVGDIHKALGADGAKDVEGGSQTQRWFGIMDRYLQSRGAGDRTGDGFDGTGQQMDLMFTRLADMKVKGELKPEEIQKFEQYHQRYLDSKTERANSAANWTMAGVGILATPFSGGLSLGFLGGYTAVAYGVKTGSEIAFQGDDRDKSNAAMANRLVQSGLDALFVAVGPEQLKSMIPGFSSGAAEQAASATIKQMGTTLEQGAEETIKRRMEQLIPEALQSGRGQITDSALHQLARQVTKPENEMVVFEALKNNLVGAVNQKSPSFLMKMAESYAHSIPLGSGQGGISAAVDSAFHWDPNKPAAENIQHTLDAIGQGMKAGGEGAVFWTTLHHAVSPALSAMREHYDNKAAVSRRIDEHVSAVDASASGGTTANPINRQQQPSGVQARIDQATVRRRINEHVPDADASASGGTTANSMNRQQQPSGVQARIDQAAVRRRINEHVPDAGEASGEPLSREPHADLTKRLGEIEARKNANETFLRLNEGSVPARATEALQALKAQLKDNKFAVPQGNSPEVSAIENHKATLEGVRNALNGTEPISTKAMIEKLESMKHMEEELQNTLSGKKKYNVCVEQSRQRQKAFDELLTKYKNDETQGEFRQRANAIEQGVSAHGSQYLRNIEEMVSKMPEGNPRQRQLKEQWQRAVKYNQYKEHWKNSLDTTGWEGVWQHIEPQQPNLAFTDIPNGFLLRDLHPPAGSPQGAVYPDAPEGNVYMAPHVTKHLMERWKQQVDIEGQGYTHSPSGQAIESGIKGDINKNIATQIEREMERFGPIQDRALQRQLREMVTAEVRSRLEHQSPPDRLRPELLQLRLQAQMQTLHEAVRQSLSKGLNYRPYDPRIDKTPYKGLRAHVELNGWQLTFCPPEPANGKPFPSVMHALDMWDMDKNLEGEHRPAD